MNLLHKISGGQKSRVALADMASRQPDVIILVSDLISTVAVVTVFNAAPASLNNCVHLLPEG